METNRKDRPAPARRLARRDFLKLAGLASGAAALAACSPRQRLLASMTASAPAPNPTPDVTPTPDPRNLCFVLWDHQLAMYNYKPRRPDIPLPQTCPLYSGARNPLTPEWQAYWRGILKVCNPGMSEEAFEQSWKSLIDPTRAFTNFSNPEEGDFVMGTLTCGGATHEMVTGEPEGRWMRIYTLNTEKDPPPIPADVDEIDITRHFMATTGSRDRLPDGSWAVYGFPQFDNPIVPLVSRDDTDLIALDRIEIVPNIMRPYNT
jgi:hypothetical protein